LLARLKPMAERYDSIYERITGKGLLIGQHFHTAEIGYAVSAGLFRRGVLISGTLTSAKSVRIEPPLVIEYDEIDAILDRLEDTLKAVSGAPVTGDVLQFPVVTSDAPMANNGVSSHSNGHSKAHASAHKPAKSGGRRAMRKTDRPLSDTVAR
jgi:hypothetical protein